jgi:hypothetical protein
VAPEKKVVVSKQKISIYSPFSFRMRVFSEPFPNVHRAHPVPLHGVKVRASFESLNGRIKGNFDSVDRFMDVTVQLHTGTI